MISYCIANVKQYNLIIHTSQFDLTKVSTKMVFCRKPSFLCQQKYIWFNSFFIYSWFYSFIL